MTKDFNKDLGDATADGIEYNYLNLPKKITVKKTATTNKGTIEYTYDATGIKLSKKTTETNAVVRVNGTDYTTNITTTTDYIAGYVYETKTYSNATVNTELGHPTKLQFTGFEEGRIRAQYNNNQAPNQLTGFVYDYMLKDHLGNVRMVITEEQKQDVYPAATLEKATVNDPISNTSGTALSVEKGFYDINESKVVNRNLIAGLSGGDNNYGNNNGAPPVNINAYSNQGAVSDWVYQTNGSQNKTGLGIVIKVMAGDVVDIFGKSFHRKPSGGYNTSDVTNNSVLDILNTLVNAPGMQGKGFISGNQLQSNFPPSTTTLLNGQPTNTANLAKASINYIIFNDQFKYITGNFDGVGIDNNGTGVLKNHQILGVDIPVNGYIYVYCSNEQNSDVYFDNLQLVHNKGAILEETHYYPFGLTMAGISSKAANITENKTKYQQYELNTDFDINLYESFYRSHDPQLGRFWQFDPRPNDMESPYAAMGNNPIKNMDILGDTVWTPINGVDYYYQPGKDGARGSLINKADGSVYNGNTAWYNQLVSSCDELFNSSNEVLSNRMKEVVSNSFKHIIIEGTPMNNSTPINGPGDDPNSTISIFDGATTYNIDEKKIDRPTEKLAHELLGHNYHAMKGTLNLVDISQNTFAVGLYNQDRSDIIRFVEGSTERLTGLPETEADASKMQNLYNISKGYPQMKYYPYPVTDRYGNTAAWRNNQGFVQAVKWFLFPVTVTYTR